MTPCAPLQDAAPLQLEEIHATRDMISPFVVRTPHHVWRNQEIAAHTADGTEIVLKLELLQHTGTFKARGALSTMLRLTDAEKKRGVTAVSAGNHATAVAYAASILGMDSRVVMIASANPARIAAARAYGAQVLIAQGSVQDAFALTERIATEEGRTFIHPFEGKPIALGTATLGCEFAEQAGQLDALLVAIGGGGLAAGVSSAFKLVQPGCRIYGVEPEGADTMHRSFAAGSPQRIETIATIADSLGPPMALPYSFALCRANVDELVKVSDEQMCRAMALLFRGMKLAVEPAAAAAVAALVGPLRKELAGKRVGVIVCGSNIDIDTFAAHLRRGEASADY